MATTRPKREHLSAQDLREREAANLAKLPELCHVAVQTEKVLCLIKRGEKGYYRTDWPVSSYEFAQRWAKERNATMGVTPAQASAMQNGSLLGWSLPIADPDHHFNRSAR